jgi:hypothetical protein
MRGLHGAEACEAKLYKGAGTVDIELRTVDQPKCVINGDGLTPQRAPRAQRRPQLPKRPQD